MKGNDNMAYRGDREYATEYRREVDFLKTQGIDYAFVKEKDGISIYKYQKTKELFEALFIFYSKIK